MKFLLGVLKAVLISDQLTEHQNFNLELQDYVLPFLLRLRMHYYNVTFRLAPYFLLRRRDRRSFTG